MKPLSKDYVAFLTKLARDRNITPRGIIAARKKWKDWKTVAEEAFKDPATGKGVRKSWIRDIARVFDIPTGRLPRVKRKPKLKIPKISIFKVKKAKLSIIEQVKETARYKLGMLRRKVVVLAFTKKWCEFDVKVTETEDYKQWVYARKAYIEKIHKDAFCEGEAGRVKGLEDALCKSEYLIRCEENKEEYADYDEYAFHYHP